MELDITLETGFFHLFLQYFQNISFYGRVRDNFSSDQVIFFFSFLSHLIRAIKLIASPGVKKNKELSVLDGPSVTLTVFHIV